MHSQRLSESYIINRITTHKRHKNPFGKKKILCTGKIAMRSTNRNEKKNTAHTQQQQQYSARQCAEHMSYEETSAKPK